MSKDGDYDDGDLSEEDKEKIEIEAEEWETMNDPYSDDEKDQMGSEEFFRPDA
ncbi:hypothetical protein [Achromobacter insuavis]|uniref:hypothetical protein n=1 Tax=Achromobacter insuavis TaxID=1287735 RepID=UPI001F130DF1|nr:hypothetical protein [Achromobacter insuavis]